VFFLQDQLHVALGDLDDTHPATSLNINLFEEHTFATDHRFNEHPVFSKSLLHTVGSSAVKKATDDVGSFLGSVVKGSLSVVDMLSLNESGNHCELVHTVPYFGTHGLALFSNRLFVRVRVEALWNGKRYWSSCWFFSSFNLNGWLRKISLKEVQVTLERVLVDLYFEAKLHHWNLLHEQASYW